MSAFVRFVTIAVSVAGLAAGGWVTPSPASAAVELLCTGYRACAKAGMSSAGYAAASTTMYWRMYGGHNCTNYAAYRMVRSGLPNARPWDGPGNATYWGGSMHAVTDGVPAVGAVAWWRAGVPPAGSAGHVAYVERVVSADEIVVSQDSWGGDFSWARITRRRGWPSGFIHFNDVPILSTAPPAVTGAPRVGEVLSASPGTWSVAGVTPAYQWRVGGTDVPGATAPTLTLTREMLDRRVRVRVTARRLGHASVTALSPATAPVEAGALTVTSPPAAAGDPRVDTTVTVTPGTWTVPPDSVAFQWLVDGAPVTGARTASFTPGPALVGRSLAVRVTARWTGYADAAVTVRLPGPVAPGVLTATGAAALSGRPRVGAPMALASVPTAPGATAQVQWSLGGVPVPGATASSFVPPPSAVGRRVRARVTLTRPGYAPLVVASPVTRPVKAPALLEVEARREGPGAVLTARVTAPGVASPSGTVRVRAAGSLLAETAVRAGLARVRLDALPAGVRDVSVVLLGTPLTTRTVAVHRAGW